MRRTLLALVVGWLLAGCGSAEPAVPVQAGSTVAVTPYVPGAEQAVTPTRAPTATPTPTPTVVASPVAAGPELWRAELRYADVPGTWSRSSVDNDYLTAPSHITCDGKRLDDPGQYTSSAGIQFAQSDAGPFLMHYLWQTATLAEARQELAFARQTFACRTWEATTPGGLNIVYRIKPLAIPTAGDESVAAHMTLEVSGHPVLELQSVYLRVGPVLSEITLAGGPQSDPTLLTTLAKTAAQRIHDAGF